MLCVGVGAARATGGRHDGGRGRAPCTLHRLGRAVGARAHQGGADQVPGRGEVAQRRARCAGGITEQGRVSVSRARLRVAGRMPAATSPALTGEEGHDALVAAGDAHVNGGQLGVECEEGKAHCNSSGVREFDAVCSGSRSRVCSTVARLTLVQRALAKARAVGAPRGVVDALGGGHVAGQEQRRLGWHRQSALVLEVCAACNVGVTSGIMWPCTQSAGTHGASPAMQAHQSG